MPSGTVSVSIESADDGICVVVSNTGSAVPPDQAVFLREPLDDDDAALLRGRVGLQLVPMILSRLGYSVTVQDNNPSGSKIRLHLTG